MDGKQFNDDARNSMTRSNISSKPTTMSSQARRVGAQVTGTYNNQATNKGGRGLASNNSKMQNGFQQFDDGFFENESVEEMERRLFGFSQTDNSCQEITDKDFIPIKTGTGVKLMRNGPKHIMDAEEFEPLYVPQENILEECLRREAERVAH